MELAHNHLVVAQDALPDSREHTVAKYPRLHYWNLHTVTDYEKNAKI